MSFDELVLKIEKILIDNQKWIFLYRENNDWNYEEILCRYEDSHGVISFKNKSEEVKHQKLVMEHPNGFLINGEHHFRELNKEKIAAYLKRVYSR